jgi:hypothetical protein
LCAKATIGWAGRGERGDPRARQRGEGATLTMFHGARCSGWKRARRIVRDVQCARVKVGYRSLICAQLQWHNREKPDKWSRSGFAPLREYARYGCLRLEPIDSWSWIRRSVGQSRGECACLQMPGLLAAMDDKVIRRSPTWRASRASGRGDDLPGAHWGYGFPSAALRRSTPSREGSFRQVAWASTSPAAFDSCALDLAADDIRAHAGSRATACSGTIRRGEARRATSSSRQSSLTKC